MATKWVAFFINIYMQILLIILNIILIVLLSIFVFYIIKTNNISIKGIFKKNDSCRCDKTKDNDDEKIDDEEIDDEDNSEPQRVFVGKIITDEEYQHIMKSRKSDISILMEDLKKEYEHLKELSK